MFLRQWPNDGLGGRRRLWEGIMRRGGVRECHKNVKKIYERVEHEEIDYIRE